MIDKDLKRLNNESITDYQIRVCSLREVKGLTWQEITDIINEELGFNYTESRYRKMYNNFVKSANEPDEDTSRRIETMKETMRLRDLRTQVNATVRAQARAEANRDLAYDCAQIIAAQKPFIAPLPHGFAKGEKAGILCISDVHYGIVFKNFLNEYSPEIAQERLEKLTQKVIEYGLKEGINDLYVANLGDMIAGMIHLQIRLESRENVVQQTMSVAELLAGMLDALSKHFNVYYYDCLDNHSRVDVNKDTSVAMESYTFFIPWYLKARLKDNPNVFINDAELDSDLITFDVFGYRVIGVHGHKDKPAEIVKQLSCLTRRNYDLAIMGHRHHFSADEQQGTVILSNGSLMGTDNYAKDLRVSSHASQNFIIVSTDNPCECIYRICLN